MKEEEIRPRSVLTSYLELVREDCRRLFANPETLSVVRCPACDSDDARPQFMKDGFEYALCGACETLFARTRPSFAALRQFYVESPSTKYWINDFFKPVAGVRREKIFKPRAAYLRDRFSPDPGWTIGDIGAGFGLFCLELQSMWPKSRCVAIEPSSEQAELCRQSGLQVICSSLEETAERSEYAGTFDLLTAFELFEHVHDAREFLLATHRLLKPNGRLFATTLNGQGFDIQILWERSKSVYPPCHLNLFNPDSISGLLKDCGFRVEEVSTPGRLDWNILDGAIRHDEFDAGRFWNHVSKQGSPQAKDELQAWITRHCFSSHMRIIATRQ